MGKPYSLDLRERVVAALEGGMSTGQAAARFSIDRRQQCRLGLHLSGSVLRCERRHY